jgi:GNAT superfamily N-acetyltransferase
MKIPTYESQKEGFVISTDPARLQLETICQFLARSYWANTRKQGVIALSLGNSLCFGMYDGEKQIGFTRVVSDYATYAWLCDVFIDEDYRGRGLGKWMMTTVMAHPQLQIVRRWSLATRDAHELYRKYGFTELKNPERIMERINPLA